MTDSPVVVFEPLYDDVEIPTRATEGAAGYDVYACLRGRRVEAMLGVEPRTLEPSGDTLVIEPGVRALIPLGFRARLPEGVEAQLRLRSSAAFRKGLVMPNAPATIDPDYPGEWMVLVTNTLSLPVEVAHGERIAQIVLSRFVVARWETGTVGVTTSRVGGLGSTGR